MSRPSQKKWKIFDLEQVARISYLSETQSIVNREQFAFYGQYHANHTNISIHLVCVPLILWQVLHRSWCFILNYLTATDFGSFVVPIWNERIALSPGFCWASAYAAYFLTLDLLAGLAYAPILLFMGYSSNYWNQIPNAVSIATKVFGFSWVAQFAGHGIFEGRAPALLDNLFQSVVLAVFFVWMELLFGLGYKPELHKRLQNRIGVEVAKFRQERAAKRARKAQ